MSHTPFPIRVGVQLQPQHTTYSDYASTVQRFDSMGVDSIFNWDHFFPLYGDPQGPHFEGWTLLTAMAAITSHAKVGCLVTCNSYRNPSLLADMAKTIDHISHGRLILGMGAGWFDRDYSEYGYDFGTPGTRLAALADALPIIQHRWEVDVPKPVQSRIPILIGGGGEKKTLKITAQYADMWHGFGGVEILTHKMEVLNQWCQELGRNPDEIERSCAVDEKVTEQQFDATIQIGITHFIVGMQTPWDFATVEKLLLWRDQRNR